MRFRRGAASTSSSTGSSTSSPTDDAELLAEAAEAEAAWNSLAPRTSAEEAYGDYQLVVDAIADRLLDIRESYARSLDDDAADEYRAEFTRAATRRFRRYATLLADLDDVSAVVDRPRAGVGVAWPEEARELEVRAASRARPCFESVRPSA